MADIAVQRFTVHLIEPDQVLDVDANRIDLRRWEAVHQVGWYDAPDTLTKLDQLAYHACVRTSQFAGTWEEFDARAASVKTRRPDPTPAPDGPTHPGPGEGSSSPLPSATGTSPPPSKPKDRTSS